MGQTLSGKLSCERTGLEFWQFVLSVRSCWYITGHWRFIHGTKIKLLGPLYGLLYNTKKASMDATSMSCGYIHDRSCWYITGHWRFIHGTKIKLLGPLYGLLHVYNTKKASMDATSMSCGYIHDNVMLQSLYVTYIASATKWQTVHILIRLPLSTPIHCSLSV